MRRSALTILVVSLLATRASSAAEIYNESVSGDLSNDRFNPTQLAVALGSNTLVATSVSGDREFFRFTVAPGQKLDAIVNTASNGQRSFIGMQNGTQMTVNPDAPIATNLLGYAHFGALDATVGTNILDNMALSNNSFSGPLPAGNYVFWSQETGGVPTTYSFDFQLSNVPQAPIPQQYGALLGLLLFGAGVWQARRLLVSS